MSALFYMKLAAQNIRKNGQTYIPYILTCIGSVMMYDILLSLVHNGEIKKMRGGSEIQYIMFLGCFIIAAFTSVFLFYTNSFLMKRRKMEIGLYNILGMGKRHIGTIMFFETAYIAGISLTAGIAGGFLLSKGVHLLLLRMVGEKVQWGFYFSAKAAVSSIVLYSFVFLAILAVNLARVHISSPLELLKGGQIGEKEPKTRWAAVLIGVASLAGGYYLALSLKNPILAINGFFVAVLLVIVGTNCLFMAGSIALLKMLRKKKSFYYRTGNFISVSGMLYRMKQNAAGLAEICILSTTVLVMLSSTAALYTGMEGVLRNRYPRNIMFRADDVTEEMEQQIGQVIGSVFSEEGVSGKNTIEYRDLSLSALYDGGTRFRVEGMGGQLGDLKQVRYLYILTQADYHILSGKQLQLSDGECMVVSHGDTYNKNTVSILGRTYQAVPAGENGVWDGADSLGGEVSYFLIVPDAEELNLLARLQEEIFGENASRIQYHYDFDLDVPDEIQSRIYTEIRERMGALPFNVRGECAAVGKADYYSLNAGLLFLGIFLGALFIMATVLIIYYKQVAEGYDDKVRFEIMQKVGLSKAEIRSSIRSQILLMFFLPLVTAAIHTAAAFPMITRLLAMMNLTDVGRFAASTAVTLVIFALAYTAVYLLTSRVYLKIVGGR